MPQLPQNATDLHLHSASKIKNPWYLSLLLKKGWETNEERSLPPSYKPEPPQKRAVPGSGTSSTSHHCLATSVPPYSQALCCLCLQDIKPINCESSLQVIIQSCYIKSSYFAQPQLGTPKQNRKFGIVVMSMCSGWSKELNSVSPPIEKYIKNDSSFIFTEKKNPP